MSRALGRRRAISAGAFGGSGFSPAHLETIAAVDGLDVEDFAPRDPQDALHGSGNVLVHPVRELDDDHGALARRPHEPSTHSPRAPSELAQHHVHENKSSIVSPGVYCARAAPRSFRRPRALL